MDENRREAKAYAYLNRSDGRLLVFDHPNPEAGTQVPKGDVEPGESPREAVVREVAEESGLTDIEVVRLLAEDAWPHPSKPKAYHRYFYRVIPMEGAPEAWTHEVTGSVKDEGMQYDYFWADPEEVSLVADMDDYVDRL